jgi:hypothetical protein
MNTNWAYVLTRARYPLEQCARCDKPAALRHHRDRDPTNLAADNVELLCLSCHGHEHSNARVAAMRRAGPLTGRYKGVCYLPNKNRWLVQIMAEAGPVRLGVHEDEEEAALIYDAAVLHYWNGGGYLNLLPDFYQART